jgi:hypothetical protein
MSSCIITTTTSIDQLINRLSQPKYAVHIPNSKRATSTSRSVPSSPLKRQRSTSHSATVQMQHVQQHQSHSNNTNQKQNNQLQQQKHNVN